MARLFPTASDRHFAEILSQLVYANPFLPERIEFERQALGDEFSEAGIVWAAQPGDDAERPNVVRLQARAELFAIALQARLARMTHVEADEARLYADLIQYVLYYRFCKSFDVILADPGRSLRIQTFNNFAKDYRYFLASGPLPSVIALEPEAHIFALHYQIRRAFHHIFLHITGTSLPAAQLRAAVWQSIFTCNLADYRSHLFNRLDDIPTLITGESGTGKELVARAIALARYIPFDPKTESFSAVPTAMFIPLNLSALSPTLIESDLFGHRRGAFTGALENRVGWLEHCPPGGSVFLDEIGELDAPIQVKLLRVLQARAFTRLGETESRPFAGKLIAATNRDLAVEMAEGRFRRDFFYRLRADLIQTPTLSQQLQGAADVGSELRLLVRFIALRAAGAELASPLTDRVVKYILSDVGINYPWPGNFRELEQCVRNILIRNEYRPSPGIVPPHPPTPHPAQSDRAARLLDSISSASLTADELLDQYAAIVYAASGSFDAAARKLNLDRRTVRTRLARLNALPHPDPLPPQE